MTMTADGFRTPPTALVTSPQNFTASWADLGAEIQTDRYKTAGLWLDLDVNDSSDMRIRALCKRDLDDTDEYLATISTVSAASIAVQGGYYEFTSDADQKVMLSIDLENLVPVIQLQIQAGTAGASPGQVENVYYSLSKE